MEATSHVGGQKFNDQNFNDNSGPSNFHGRTITDIQLSITSTKKKLNKTKEAKLNCIALAIAFVATNTLTLIFVLPLTYPLFLTTGLPLAPFAIVGGFAVVALVAALFVHNYQKFLEKKLVSLEQELQAKKQEIALQEAEKYYLSTRTYPTPSAPPLPTPDE